MTPTEMGGNMWRLDEGEFVSGEGGTIEGPKVVRVFEYPEIDELLVQAGGKKVAIKATNFSSVVQKKDPSQDT